MKKEKPSLSTVRYNDDDHLSKSAEKLRFGLKKEKKKNIYIYIYIYIYI